MKKRPKVSGLIINYNGEKDTLECLKSLGKVDYNNFNVFIIDNNSKESVEKLESFSKKRKNMNLIKNKKNKGFAGGNNTGIKEALKDKDTDYVLLLNNDTTVKKDFLTKLVDFAEKNSHAGVVSSRINKYSDKSKSNITSGRFNFWRGGGKPIKLQNKPYKVEYADGCCWLIKRDVIEKTKGFNEKYFLYKEEIEWAYRINKKGYNFYIVPDSIIYHKGEQSTKKSSGLRQYYETRNSLFFVREHGNFLQKIFFICYTFSYKLLKQLYLNFKSGKDIWIKDRKLFKGVRDGLFDSYN